MSTPTTTPGGSSPDGNPGQSTSKGFLTLILLSVGILLLGWGLMTLLDRIMG